MVTGFSQVLSFVGWWVSRSVGGNFAQLVEYGGLSSGGQQPLGSLEGAGVHCSGLVLEFRRMFVYVGMTMSWTCWFSRVCLYRDPPLISNSLTSKQKTRQNSILKPL